MERQMLFVKCPLCKALVPTTIHADEVTEDADMSGSHVCERCGVRVEWAKSDVIKEGVTWKKSQVEVTIGKASDK
jgi:protein-arginine kinase activator protein McsA